MQADSIGALTRVRGLTNSGTARAIRLGAGLSLGEIARAIGVSPSTVLRWERRERTPRGEKALAYAQVLEELLAR